MSLFSRGFHGRPRRGRRPGARAARAVRRATTSRCSRRARRRARSSTTWSFTIQGAVGDARVVDVGRVPRAADRDVHDRHPLRDEVDEARHDAGRASRSTRCSTASSSEADYVTVWSDGGYTTNLAIADITGGKAWVVDTFDGRAARARARRPGAPARARTCTSGRARSGCAG